jgi:ABC-type Fe3+/spermidine/putrescine transport system ATPase subunit
MAKNGHLIITDLTKRLGNSLAVAGISFEVLPGTLTCLLGPSGCGKTTTLRMVAGLLDPDAGDVRIDGESMIGVPANRRPTSIVFQDYALFPHMTVRQNVSFGLRRRTSDASTKKAVDELLDVISLTEVADRHPGSLSGGQQQRVALARSLALRPDVLLMDEPLSNLDAKVRVTLRAELRRVQREFGTTILYVTHDQEEAMAISDEIVVMAQGSAQQIGTATDIYRMPQTPFVADFIGLGTWLAAECVSTSPDATIVEADQGVIELAGECTPYQPKVGDKVALFVRPEHVDVDPNGETQNGGVVGRLISRQFMGSLERLFFETKAGRLVLMDSQGNEPSRDLREDDEVTLRFATDRVRVFEHAAAESFLPMPR